MLKLNLEFVPNKILCFNKCYQLLFKIKIFFRKLNRIMKLKNIYNNLFRVQVAAVYKFFNQTPKSKTASKRS